MTTPRQYLEFIASVPTGASCIGFASAPANADSALIHVEVASMRWSETFGSFLTASVGMPIAPADAGVVIGNLSAFRITGLAAGGVVQAAYYWGLEL
jgi:hypothetical protein